MSRSSMSREGGTNAGAPTLTTPTLTPTTLRNIEQMFADRDPHEPPPHHVNAAGFVPPIISPSAGSTFLSLVSTPSSEVTGISLPDLISPTLAEFIPDLANGRSNGNIRLPTKPLPLTTKLSPTSCPQLSAVTKLSPSSSASALPAIVEKLASLPPLVLKNAEIKSQPTDLTISLRPPNSAEKKERPPSLQLGPLNLNNGKIINKKMERLDNILKSVAGSSTVVSVESAAEDISERVTVTKAAIKEEEEVKTELRVRKESGHDQGQLQGNFHGHERETDDDRKKQRRDRNRQAAARCRKRRMDLTCALQGEVDEWEDKNRSIKEELSKLETQKKGLEAILRKHTGGACKKLVKSEVD